MGTNGGDFVEKYEPCKKITSLKNEYTIGIDIEKEMKIKNLYKNLICKDNLKDGLDYLFKEVSGLLSLEKIALFESDCKNKPLLKKIIDKNNIEIDLKVIDEIMLNNKFSIYNKNLLNKNSSQFIIKEKIEKNFEIIFYVEFFEKENENNLLINFIKELVDIIKSMYLKEFKYLALVRESYRDGLTNCYNRNYFELKMLEFKKMKNLGMIVFDLDCLKDINDKLGHDFGDEIIKRTVEIINSIIKPEDILCRFGGDEFVLLVKDSSEKKIELLIKEIEEKFKEKNKNNFPIYISLGYSIKVKEKDSIKETFKLADYKMYGKKMKNKRHQLF